jgi:hypothetical protein
LHVVGSSSALDVPRLVVKLGSNGQWLLMEVPSLWASSISSLDSKVGVVDQVEVSSWWKSRDNVEWSFNVETEVLVEFSLLWLFWIFIGVDDVPLLTDIWTLWWNFDVFVFIIEMTWDI